MSMTTKEAVEKVKNILTEIEVLNDDLSALKEEIQESGLDAKIIIKTAKLLVSEKTTEFLNTAHNVETILDEIA